jgi:hypothetical protein
MRHAVQFIAIGLAGGSLGPRVRFNATHPTEPTMTSRLTAIALMFAVFSTASLAVATTLRHDALTAPAAKPVRVVQLETVVITAKRMPQAAR